MKKRELFKNYSRRSIIKGLGLTAAAPFVPVLSADAADGTAPKRLMVILTPNGFGDGAIPKNLGVNYEHGDAFKALNPYRQDMSILRGFGFTGHTGGGAPNVIPLDGRGYNVNNGHPALAPHLLTNQFTNSVDGNAASVDGVFHAEGPSIDQVISQRFMANPATETALPFIYAGVKTQPGSYYHQVYEAPEKSLFPQTSAQSLHAQIFDTNATQSTGDAAFNQRFAERRSIIDYAKAEIDKVKQVLSSEDVKKMEAHLEGIVELERQLAFQENSGGGGACAIPELKTTNSGELAEQFRIDGENMMDLIVQAFACDRTRVATLMWANTASTLRFAGMNHDMHDATHEPFAMEASKMAARDAYSKWFADRFVYLIEKMKQIPEGDGNGSMLDNTMIIWTSEHTTQPGRYLNHPQPDHNRENIPFILAGGAGGALRQGQFIDYFDERTYKDANGNDRMTPPLPQFTKAQGLAKINDTGIVTYDQAFNNGSRLIAKGRSHGDVFVTALHAMGFDDKTFGLPGLCAGPITELLNT